MLQPHQPPWIFPPDQLVRLIQPGEAPAKDDSRRNSATRYGRLAGNRQGRRPLVSEEDPSLVGAPASVFPACLRALQCVVYQAWASNALFGDGLFGEGGRRGNSSRPAGGLAGTGSRQG